MTLALQTQSLDHSRLTQAIYDQTTRNYTQQFPLLEQDTQEFCGFITLLERRNNCFLEKRIVKIPTSTEFAEEGQMHQVKIKNFLKRISDAKDLQQICLVASDYFKPPMVANTLDTIRECNPELYEVMKRDFEICKKHFDEVVKLELQTKVLVEEMERRSKDARAHLLTFNQIAQSNGNYSSGLLNSIYKFIAKPAVSRAELLKERDSSESDKQIGEVIQNLSHEVQDNSLKRDAPPSDLTSISQTEEDKPIVLLSSQPSPEMKQSEGEPVSKESNLIDSTNIKKEAAAISAQAAPKKAPAKPAAFKSLETKKPEAGIIEKK